MRISSAAQVSLLLALIVGCFVADAKRHRITVKKYKTNYRIDWWDDGRDEPYRVTFWKFGLKSVYLFQESGNLKSLTVRDREYLFSSAIGSGLLRPSEEDQDEDVDPPNQRRLFGCADCEGAWDTLCDAGLADVCFLHDNPQDDFNEDADDSLRRMCSSFGAACLTSSFDTCEGQCVEEDACDPNPCENGGSCSIDPAGGHVCSCASNYGGMACQTDTSSLDPFYIEIDFVGTWTDERRDVFQAAADRWSEVITHVPCGGNSDSPAGRLLITSTLEIIDGVGGTLGSASADTIWQSCPSISLEGSMRFDIQDIVNLEAAGTFEGVILHEMGHVIGVGTLWGAGFGECTTCRQNDDPAWTCPAAISAYAAISGTDADIVELDGAVGTRCSHLDETIFDDELMTGFLDNVMYLSKMTGAILDDLDYVVDPSAVDAYTLPSQRGGSIRTDLEPSMAINDTAVDSVIYAMDGDGNVVEEKNGVRIIFYA